jgi:sulfite reductase alpha subunit-like flavoprotein
MLRRGLGDDGKCIEDDFDVWMAKLVSSLVPPNETEQRDVSMQGERLPVLPCLSKPANSNPIQTTNNERKLSAKYQPLKLLPPVTDVVRDDLRDLPIPFYQAGFEKLPVVDNRPLSVVAGEQGLREIVVSTDGHDICYEAGDHLMIYPKNASCMVEAYQALLDINPHSTIASADRGSNYPHPTRVTIAETLTHCVDLSATPTPAFARILLGKREIDYKNQVSGPRRTALDLIHESGLIPSLEDLLHGLPAMKPRYYSIASSPIVHPEHVYLAYRPVKYLTSRGYLREGVCTSYLSTLGVGETAQSSLIGALSSNPTFRLPHDHSIPILLIAGGCGIAPIRSFLEDRLAGKQHSYGKSHLFVGFRSPQDEVYRAMIDEASACGVLHAQVSYSSGCSPRGNQRCGNVSDIVRANSWLVWDLIQSGGFIYLCGGARGFGVAIETELLCVLREHGSMDAVEAANFLRELARQGRLCEDLAD